jgi:uncharacterized membrane protein
MHSIITADQTWELWTVLLIAVLVGFWSQKTRIGARFSAAVVTMLITFTLSNLGVIPTSSPVYSQIWNYLVPLAIPLLLFQTNFMRILRESGATLIAFAIGIVGVIVGTFIAYLLVPLGDADWQLAGMFSANYIGDSLNYYNTAKALEMQTTHILTTGVAAINLMMIVYLLVLFTLPSMYQLRRYFIERTDPDRFGNTEQVLLRETERGGRHSLPSLTMALALSAALCAISFQISAWLGWPGMTILIITALAVLLTTAMPNTMIKLESTNELGMVIMQLLFATIGASAHVGNMLDAGPLLFVYAGIIFLVHLLFIVIGGKFMKLSLPDIVIASNASLGNPVTAIAMAAARRWNNLMLPAVICGSLGYTIATFIGSMMGTILK